MPKTKTYITIDNEKSLATAKHAVDAARKALKEADEQLAKALESFIEEELL